MHSSMLRYATIGSPATQRVPPLQLEILSRSFLSTLMMIMMVLVAVTRDAGADIH